MSYIIGEKIYHGTRRKPVALIFIENGQKQVYNKICVFEFFLYDLPFINLISSSLASPIKKLSKLCPWAAVCHRLDGTEINN